MFVFKSVGNSKKFTFILYFVFELHMYCARYHIFGARISLETVILQTARRA